MARDLATRRLAAPCPPSPAEADNETPTGTTTTCKRSKAPSASKQSTAKTRGDKEVIMHRQWISFPHYGDSNHVLPQHNNATPSRPKSSTARNQLLPAQSACRLGGSRGRAEPLAARRAMILRATGRDPDLRMLLLGGRPNKHLRDDCAHRLHRLEDANNSKYDHGCKHVIPLAPLGVCQACGVANIRHSLKLV